MQSVRPCDNCAGSGKVISNPCQTCRGTGFEKKTRTVVDSPGKDAWDEVINHPAEYGTRKVEAGKKHVKEVWHYEYEKGWRDGDFKYKG